MANFGDNTVSVIATASKTVVGSPIKVGGEPECIGIVPHPPGIPFLTSSASLTADLGTDFLSEHWKFVLSSASKGIDPVTEPVMVTAGQVSLTIPPGSFTKHKDGTFSFTGQVAGAAVNAGFTPTVTLGFAFFVQATGLPNLSRIENPSVVTLTIGDASGFAEVRPIFH